MLRAQNAEKVRPLALRNQQLTSTIFDLIGSDGLLSFVEKKIQM